MFLICFRFWSTSGGDLLLGQDIKLPNLLYLWVIYFWIRRIWLFVVIRSVPGSRVMEALPSSPRVGDGLHFYRPWLDLRDSMGRDVPYRRIRSSSELLIVDRILSLEEYEETLPCRIKEVESFQGALVDPEAEIPSVE